MIVIFRLQALLALSLGLSAVSLNARAQLLLEHPEAGTILDELREAVGESSSSGAGKSFTRLVKRSSLSVESSNRASSAALVITSAPRAPFGKSATTNQSSTTLDAHAGIQSNDVDHVSSLNDQHPVFLIRPSYFILSCDCVSSFSILIHISCFLAKPIDPRVVTY